jgi:hypothetical protein
MFRENRKNKWTWDQKLKNKKRRSKWDKARLLMQVINKWWIRYKLLKLKRNKIKWHKSDVKWRKMSNDMNLRRLENWNRDLEISNYCFSLKNAKIKKLKKNLKLNHWKGNIIILYLGNKSPREFSNRRY